VQKSCREKGSLTPDKFDLATLTKTEDGKLAYHELTEAESQKLLDAAKEEVASADA